MKINSSNINIRKLNAEDLDLLVRYRMLFLKELQKPDDKNAEAALDKSLRNYFSRSLKDGSYIAVVAEYDGQPISFGGMVLQDIPGHFTFISGRQGYILNMYTLPEYRGSGLSTMLLNKLLDEAAETGLTKVYLHATDDGINIYRKAGFAESSWPVLELTF